MIRDYWQTRFDELGADGVDFVGMLDTPWRIQQMYATKTKEEMLAGCTYPRSNYLFWKMVNGKKEYIYQEHHKISPGSVIHRPNHKVMFMVQDHFGDKEMWGAFADQDVAEEMCLSLTEEAAYEDALDLYYKHHHWDWARCCKTAWSRNKFNYSIEAFNVWDF